MIATALRGDPPWRAPWLRPARTPARWVEPAAWASGACAEQAHPLADAALSEALRQRAQEIDAAFARIEPLLRELAPRQFDADFAAVASRRLRAELGVDVAADGLRADWTRPLDFGRIYARSVLAVFCGLLERGFDRNLARLHEGEDAAALIRRFGFHALDIAPCADGRLAGVVDHILRVPPAIVAFRKSCAGAMFDVEESLRHWEAVELRRWREGVPNAAAEPTRFLKIGVYHFSSVDPRHEGCAAHGSDDARAAGALLERLNQFAAAVQATHCCGASVATLLAGVDTDTDAIRLHVPDASGRMALQRFVCARQLHERTAGMTRAAAKEAIRSAVAECAGVDPADPATEGMRWLCGYLVKNNIAQVDAVRRGHGAGYPERGHAERLIVVGDPLDDVQARNVAFQAQMDTVEEGAGDLAVGLKILGGLVGVRGLAVPVLAHAAYDGRIPGARERARQRATRLARAIEARFGAETALAVQPVVRAAGARRAEPADAACGAEGGA